MVETRRPALVICGNGASAVALMHALACQGLGPLTVFVIGPGEPGEGLAYATRSPSHLLNSPAGRMSIDPREPDQFVHWLEQHNLWVAGWANQFVLRSHYGEYLRESARQLQAASSLNIHFLRAEVISLTRNHAGWRVAHGAGQIDADIVVVATGNDMPSPVAPRLASAVRRLVVDNPWALPPTDPYERVLILGTGLTAVDTVLTLMDRGHRGEIALLSRHGLLPQVHVRPRARPALAEPYPQTVTGLLRALRAAAGRAGDDSDWQGLMDAMRPCWPRIWRQLPPAEQRRFLRHGAAIWNMHRHRVPPQVARRLHQVLGKNGKVIKGHLAGVRPGDDGAAAVSISRGQAETQIFVDRIINCMGPNTDPEKTHNRLIENVVASLQARTAPPGIGLDVTDDHRVIGHDGLAHAGLFAMGALTRGHWWDITALPEIVHQARDIARNLASARYRDIMQSPVSAG